MKCTYKFKNHDIGTAINVLCGKNYVQEAIREQYDNNSETIDFEFQSDPGESEIWGHISVSKSKIERVRAYDPDDWAKTIVIHADTTAPYSEKKLQHIYWLFFKTLGITDESRKKSTRFVFM